MKNKREDFSCGDAGTGQAIKICERVYNISTINQLATVAIINIPSLCSSSTMWFNRHQMWGGKHHNFPLFHLAGFQEIFLHFLFQHQLQSKNWNHFKSNTKPILKLIHKWTHCSTHFKFNLNFKLQESKEKWKTANKRKALCTCDSRLLLLTISSPLTPVLYNYLLINSCQFIKLNYLLIGRERERKIECEMQWRLVKIPLALKVFSSSIFTSRDGRLDVFKSPLSSMLFTS